jgi:hypothetical protein
MMRGMKKLTQELRYDGASIDQVHEMLADPAFRERVCEFQRVIRHDVRIEATGDTMTVRIDQFQAADGVPAFARKFVGEEIHILHEEDWTAQEKGNLHISIPGKPGEMNGTALLTEDPEGTTETVNMTIKVNIPLVGSKIEGLISELLTKAFRAEHHVGREWLAGQR